MAYDEALAARISDLMHARPGVVERKMFGGMGWTLDGNMAVGIMRTDHLLVRMPPEEVDEAIRAPQVHEFGRPGRKPMKGFVLVEGEAVADDAALEEWVERGVARARELPAK
jgi:TfoX/Sxy family transcriptional regulator of competence genes